MDPKERLKFCKFCSLRKFENSSGIVCSLTNKKPTFEVSCPDFKQDAIQIKRQEARAVKEEMSNSFPVGAKLSTVLVIIFMIIRFIIRNN